jgi:drug/metabolite transporter (DMT)-like permease
MTYKRFVNSPALPYFILIFLSIVWGSSFILIKRGLDAFDALQVGTLRITFASLVILPIALRYLKSVYKHNWKKFVALGLVANFLPAILFAAAETELKSSLAGILNSLTPMMTMIIGAAAFRTPMNKNQILGLAIGLIGSITLSFVDSKGGLGSFNFFALFVLAATVCYGTGANMVKTFFININPVVLTSLAMFSIGPISIVYLFSTDFLEIMAVSPDAWSSLGYLFILGALNTAFAVIFFNKLIQITTAVFASTVTYLMPIVAVIWGIVDGEALFILHFLGMGLIILGVYLVNRYKYVK